MYKRLLYQCEAGHCVNKFNQTNESGKWITMYSEQTCLYTTYKDLFVYIIYMCILFRCNKHECCSTFTIMSINLKLLTTVPMYINLLTFCRKQPGCKAKQQMCRSCVQLGSPNMNPLILPWQPPQSNIQKLHNKNMLHQWYIYFQQPYLFMCFWCSLFIKPRSTVFVSSFIPRILVSTWQPSLEGSKWNELNANLGGIPRIRDVIQEEPAVIFCSINLVDKKPGGCGVFFIKKTHHHELTNR